jgi:hypothetical protein
MISSYGRACSFIYKSSTMGIKDRLAYNDTINQDYPNYKAIVNRYTALTYPMSIYDEMDY